MVHVAIIGAYGSAGVSVADTILDRTTDIDIDIELTLIDDGDPGGGLCILDGCMPSKDVLSVAQHRYQARHDDRLDGVPTVDPEAVVARKDEHIHGFAAHRRDHVHDLTTHDNVEFIHDTARFIEYRSQSAAGYTLTVGDRTIEPDYVVIATGSTVNVPDIPGIENVSYSTSSDVLDATAFPDSAIVMGFGYIGLELVPYLAEVGDVDLTVIEHDAYPLEECDPEYGRTILDVYREHFGVEILTETTERRLERTSDDSVRLFVDRDENGAGGSRGNNDADGRGESNDTDVVEADHLYLFTGRRPNIDGLGLENTPFNPGSGWIESTMQARDADRIFVVGDANGREPILHVAKEQGMAAGENLIRHAQDAALEPYTNIPHHVIFSGLAVYPFARLGHTPATVTELEMDAIVVTRNAADDGVFKTKNHPEGVATLIVGEDGTVLGYQGLHLHADVMAKTMQLAVELGLDVRDIPDRAYHPTTPEILDGLIRDAVSELATQ